MASIDRERWSELEPLLDHALELQPLERQSWLVELRTRSAELAAELEAILDGEADADERGFLAPALGAELAGMELGGYTIERPLGRGGMGSVWLARRTDGRFEGVAAVKLLNLSLLGPGGRARFEREGSVLARLAHPNIARLLDAGVTPAGQPYLVLEHIEGRPIDEYVASRALPAEERLQLFLQVLAAVGHAHANLIVHRDLKPSNILVTEDGTVKLLDFGIAKLLAGDGGRRLEALTMDSGRVLTPEHAAPEQVSGGAITTATDVYLLGVLLYLLLSGRHPTAEGCTSPADAVRALFEVEPTRLKLGDLDTIVRKALRKEPGERYQTVAELADDVSRYLRYEPVSARGASVRYRVGKFVRRHRAGVAAATLAMAALLASTVFSMHQMRVARSERDAAVFARKRANAQVEFQTLLMSQVGDGPITMREILERSRRALERQYGADPRFLASLLAQLSERYAELGDSKVRGSLLVRADSLAVASGDHDVLTQVRCYAADNLRTEGLYPEAEHAMERADSMVDSRTDPRVKASCLQVLADLDNEAGPGGRALPAIRRAIAIRDSLGDTRDMGYVGMISTLAYSLDRGGRPRAAVPIFARAAAILDSTGRGETIARAIVDHDMAGTYMELGETASAERLFHESLARVMRSDPAGQLPTQPLIHYAHAALFDEHVDSAEKYFSILARQSRAANNSYWEGRALFGLARAQLRLGHGVDARRSIARFEQIERQGRIGSVDDEITDGRILDAWLALARSDTATAHKLATEVLKDNGYFDGKRRKIFRSAMILAAESALALGDARGALQYAQSAGEIATSDSLCATRSAFVGEARLMEGRARLALGDSSAARADFQHALGALRYGAGADHPFTIEAERLLALVESDLKP
ncbi:MAG TPA: serine/threonine-protein kinase [Gemmatimonadaceae bacterium]|nr:serine/threonine-protein kinase [Gemmatimonadaceae bacterium]